MSGKFNSYKQSLLDGTAPDLTTATVKAMLISQADSGAITASTADFLNDLEDSRYAGPTDQTLASKTTTNAAFNAAAWVYTSVVADAAKSADIVIFYAALGGASSADPVIAWWDAFTGQVPDGNNITCTPHASGLFKV